MLTHNKKVLVTAINAEGQTLGIIEGLSSGGSINVDGKSAVRRSCQFSIISANDQLDTEYDWVFGTRFKVEIEVNGKWSKQGVYVLTSYNDQLSTNSHTISISGKDKMCLLNGEISGNVNSQVDFGKYDQTYSDDEGKVYTKTLDYPIVDIIRDAVHHYGGEPFYNIFIRDLEEETGKIRQTYRYTEPAYLVREKDQSPGTYNHITFIKNNDWTQDTYNSSTGKIEGTTDSRGYYEVQYGQTIGYQSTELTYAGDLIANAGEPITSILDKIVNMLGAYEYFYDINGAFIFQKQKVYESASINNNTLRIISPIQYEFNDASTFSAINNTPNIANVRNDYSVWGERQGVSASIPVCMRLAIDRKPTKYKTVEYGEADKDLIEEYNNKYGLNLKSQESRELEANEETDWRYLIYHMALDYNKYGRLSNFEQKLKEGNPWVKNGKTGYEQYYTDLVGFWPQMCMSDSISKFDKAKYDSMPETLNYYIDFLEPTENSILAKYSVPEIGHRPKVESKGAKALMYRITPEINFVTDISEHLNNDKVPKNYVQLPSQYKDMLSSSAQGVSCRDVLNDLLYKHSYCVESITITCEPIYDLQPNKNIKISNTAGLDGEYTVKSFTIPLQYNGMMSITAIKVENNIMEV